jgi:hypothetical protein
VASSNPQGGKPERKRTLRHPDNGHFCGCVSACMLTKAECRRKQVRCRYKSGQVKPLSHLTVVDPDKRGQR